VRGYSIGIRNNETYETYKTYKTCETYKSYKSYFFIDPVF
jgi:hypothetical protein